MLFATFKTGLLALGTLCLFGCRPTQTAFFKPTTATSFTPVSGPDRLVQIDSLPVIPPAPDQALTQAGPPPVVAATNATSARHANPDAQPTRRRTWLDQRVLFAQSGESYTAQRLPIDVPAKRTVPKGAVYALAGSALPYGLLLINSLPVWAWWLSLSLPVASLFLATGALTKIRRNKPQYRGKGWAIAAMLLATSYLGMVLVAVAALTTSGVLWE